MIDNGPAIDGIATLSGELLKARFVSSRAVYAAVDWMSAFAATVAVAIGVVLATVVAVLFWFTTFRLGRPMRQIVDTMGNLAAGDLDTEVPALDRGDEIGKMATAAQVFKDSALENIRLRVRPETLCRITEFSEHESNGRELDEGERVAVEVLPVLGQSAAAVEPGDGAFDHPTPGLDDEALHPIGSLDDLGLEIGQDAGQGAVKDRPLIGAVGEQFPEKGKQTEQGRQQRETAVAILNVGGGDDAVQQQALRIDQNMPLLALDQLAGIEAVAVDASPPFSALFTL